MKKPSFITASLLATGLLLSGCGDTASEERVAEEEADPVDEYARDLPSHIEEMQLSLAELRNHLNASAGAEEIQETADVLQEHWDRSSGQIKELYPEEYVDIEASIVPLLEEAKQENPDSDKMKELTETANGQLNELLDRALEPKKEEGDELDQAQ